MSEFVHLFFRKHFFGILFTIQIWTYCICILEDRQSDMTTMTNYSIFIGNHWKVISFEIKWFYSIDFLTLINVLNLLCISYQRLKILKQTLLTYIKIKCGLIANKTTFHQKSNDTTLIKRKNPYREVSYERLRNDKKETMQRRKLTA